VSPKRLDHVAPPSVGDEWTVKFGETAAARGWEALCAHAKTKTREAFEFMRQNPRTPQDTSHHQLRDDLSTRLFQGRELEQWQIKVSGSGRIWYLPDDQNHTVWVVYASAAHPKSTE
jgi:hypothetical protein